MCPCTIRVEEININIYFHKFAVIVVASGWPLDYGDKVAAANKAEVLNSDGTRLCHLPDLPDKHIKTDKRYLASIAEGMICGGYSNHNHTFEKTCIKLQHDQWTELPWKLKQRRRAHVTWKRPDGKTMLLGGLRSSTSEIVSESGSVAGFPLKYRTQ